MLNNGNTAKALADLRGAGLQYKLWSALGWQDIKQRYRRSFLGPFWLTLSTAILVVAMGPLYGTLLGQKISSYFPYVAASMIVWFFISALVTDSCQVFIAAEGHIKQTRLPISLFVFQMIWRNCIIFAHNLVILIPLYLFTSATVNIDTFLALPGMLLLIINAVWLGLLLGMVCVRFRDVPMIVASLLQVAFFLTPIFWKPEMLGRHQWVAHVNPLYHMVEVMRDPLVGKVPSMLSWAVVAGMACIGMGVAFFLFSRFRARIAYWA